MFLASLAQNNSAYKKKYYMLTDGISLQTADKPKSQESCSAHTEGKQSVLYRVFTEGNTCISGDGAAASEIDELPLSVGFVTLSYWLWQCEWGNSTNTLAGV